jgi:hypothetical protein
MAIEIIYTVYDAKGAKSTHSVWLPDGTTLADAQTFATSYSELLDAVIDGRISKIGIVYEGTLGTVKETPVAGCDVEQGALFIYNAGDFLFRHRLPTFTPTLIVANSRAVDLTDEDVTAFVAGMVTGLAGTSPCEHRGTDISALKSARELYQRSRR